MIAMFSARLLCGLAVLVPVVLALQPIQAAAQTQLAPVQRVPLRPVVEIAHVVDDGTNLLVLPIVRLGTMERLYVRGADLAIINSSACSLLALAERLECLEKLSRDIAPPSPQRCHRDRISAGHQTYGRHSPPWLEIGRRGSVRRLVAIGWRRGFSTSSSR